VEGGCEMVYKLNKTDLKIIYSLKNDVRQTITQIAETAGISRPTVIHRLNRLIHEGIIRFDVGVNIKRLGFHVACVGLEVKGIEHKRALEEKLSKCPRILMLTCPSEKANLSMYLFGEDIETLRSVIERLREFSNTEIVYMFHSEPPIYPKAFSMNLYPKKSSRAPCGRKCEECYNYQHNLCVGCPAVKAYKGQL
jgi:DNA-binding Lrp family transcriptional regulator